MKKSILRNLIILAAVLLLIIPYNLVYTSLSNMLSTYAYAAVILYFILCGFALALMDLSNKWMNLGLVLVFLTISLIGILCPLFSYGPTAFLFIMITGSLAVSAIKVFWEKPNHKQ